VADARAEELLALVAEHRRERDVAIDDVAAHAAHADAGRVLLEQQPVPRLGIAQRGFGSEARGDVAEAPDPDVQLFFDATPDRVALEAPPIEQFEQIEALRLGARAQGDERLLKLLRIRDLLEQAAQRPLVVAAVDDVLLEAPHVEETLVVRDDAAAFTDDQDAVRGRVERRLQQRDGLQDLALGAFAVADVAADDHRAGGLSFVHDRRDGEGEVDALAGARREDVLVVAQRAAAELRRDLAVLSEEVVDPLAGEIRLVVAEERRRGAVREFDPAVASADEQRVGHRPDDLRRRERRRDRDEVVFAHRMCDDEDEAEDRQVAERVRLDAVLRQVVDAAEVGDAEGGHQQADAAALVAVRLRKRADELDEREHEIAEEEGQKRQARRDAVARVEAPPVLLHARDQAVGGDGERAEDAGEDPRRDQQPAAFALDAEELDGEPVDRRRDERHAEVREPRADEREAGVVGRIERGEGRHPDRDDERHREESGADAREAAREQACAERENQHTGHRDRKSVRR
jgi:hypothetical protein